MARVKQPSEIPPSGAGSRRPVARTGPRAALKTGPAFFSTHTQKYETVQPG